MNRWMGLTFLLLVFLFFSACSKLSKKGTAPSNIPPEAFIVNIPTDSSQFNTLDTLYWYGFDQDGYITRYQYLVIADTCDTGYIVPKDSDGYILSSFVQTIERMSPENWNDSYVSSSLNIGKSFIHADDSAGTFDKVMFFASEDTSAIVPQYFFVRAVDNEGAVSKIWKPDSEKGSNFRFFKRTNIPPNTTIKYDTAIVEYCLPETTTDWGGIRIGWSGIDPDYRKNPPLFYSWKLYGPYALKPPKDIDTTKDLYYSSWDGITNSPWVDSTSRLLVGLENAPEEDFGWYQFRVQARDDAFVPDPTPAIATFKIIKPPFLFSENDQNKVLLVDATSYDGRIAVPDTAKIRGFYRGLLDSLVAADSINSYSYYRYDPVKVLPLKEEVASHYKLVILFNEGRYSAIQGYPILSNDTGFILLERYLKVGGRVWMIGQNNFGVNDIPVPTYIRIDPSNQSGGFTQATGRLANYYFGVTGYFHPAFNTPNSRTDEMIAAEPYGTHTELPRLELDSAKLSYYKGISGLKAIPRASWESVWNANYNERLYTFISFYPDTSKCHGRACASRAYDPYPWVFYENGQPHILRWKTAEFSFPALAMKESQMLEMMKVMVSWFMSDEETP